MEYLMQKKNIPFEVQAFTSPEVLIDFAKTQPIEILLISDKAMTDEVKQLPIRQIVILSEGVHDPQLDQYPAVYKYQSSDNVIREVMACYGVENGVVMNRNGAAKKEMRVIGIYSPVGRTQKTSFALALGQILGRDRAVLYLNLENYSGFEQILETHFDQGLSDILYYARQENTGIVYKIAGMVQTIQNLDFLPPALFPMDIQTTKYEEWIWLFRQLEQNSNYEVLILDFGDGVGDLYQLLDYCTEIYVPIRQDTMSLAKIAQFEQTLQLWDSASIMNKMKKIRIPFYSAGKSGKAWVEELAWSELGDYVRKLLHGDAAG